MMRGRSPSPSREGVFLEPRFRFALAALASSVLALSYYWAIWGTGGDLPKIRYAWAAGCALVLLVGAVPWRPLRRCAHWTRRTTLQFLPAAWVACVLVGTGVQTVLWPALSTWRATSNRLLDELLATPSKLSWGVANLVALKRRVGDRPVILSDRDLFTRFVPEMLELNLDVRPAFPDRLSADDEKELADRPYRGVRSVLTYLPEVIEVEYRIVDPPAGAGSEPYVTLRGPSGAIWLVPRSLVPAGVRGL